MANKVYSGTWHISLGAGGFQTIDFSLQSVGREVNIKSISLNLALYAVGLTQKYDWRTMQSQLLFTVGNGPDRICHSFNAPTIAPAFMGSYIEFYEPGQMLFDGFFFVNNLPMQLFIMNNEGAGREYWFTIVIETTEKTMFIQ